MKKIMHHNQPKLIKPKDFHAEDKQRGVLAIII
jgi:hypothetical protein